MGTERAPTGPRGELDATETSWWMSMEVVIAHATCRVQNTGGMMGRTRKCPGESTMFSMTRTAYVSSTIPSSRQNPRYTHDVTPNLIASACSRLDADTLPRFAIASALRAVPCEQGSPPRRALRHICS